jgi:hypothetical protein
MQLQEEMPVLLRDIAEGWVRYLSLSTTDSVALLSRAFIPRSLATEVQVGERYRWSNPIALPVLNRAIG